jgi:hypothetical protein
MYIESTIVEPIYTDDIAVPPILTAILISLVVCILYILTCFTYYLLILQS